MAICTFKFVIYLLVLLVVALHFATRLFLEEGFPHLTCTRSGLCHPHACRGQGHPQFQVQQEDLEKSKLQSFVLIFFLSTLKLNHIFERSIICTTAKWKVKNLTNCFFAGRKVMQA